MTLSCYLIVFVIGNANAYNGVKLNCQQVLISIVNEFPKMVALFEFALFVVIQYGN